MTVLDLPPGALVLMIGPAGSGKSTLAARHFSSAEILASDDYRAAVSGDATDQSATREAFRGLHADLERRLAGGELTVVDATNVQGWARRRLLEAAARHARPTVALVLALPLEIIQARNAGRAIGRVPSAAVKRQDGFMRSSLKRLEEEGYLSVVLLSDPGQVERLEVRRGFRTQRNVPKERHPTL
ncbi:MAG: AAA family ATPase [Candidatus Limnocylindria bacterium]